MGCRVLGFWVQGLGLRILQPPITPKGSQADLLRTGPRTMKPDLSKVVETAGDHRQDQLVQLQRKMLGTWALQTSGNLFGVYVLSSSAHGSLNKVLRRMSFGISMLV